MPDNKVCGVTMADKQLSECGKQGSVTAANSAAANSLSTNDNPMVNSPDMPDQIQIYLNDGAEVERAWEIEEAQHVQPIRVKGRLRDCLYFWEEVLQAPTLITDCIQSGYKLPLLFEPPPYQRANQQTALDHKEFVSGAIAELLGGGCVQRVDSIPYICSPLSVVVSSGGKKRLVINLRYLNQFLRKDSFKYEGLSTLMTMIDCNDFLFKFDLKSGYHHIEIFEPHWRYLGFAWNNEGVEHYYVFTVLPFGLATACYIFTKIMRQLVKYWRSKGLRAVVYLDDGIVAVQGLEAAKRSSHMVKDTLVNAGFVTHVEKSQWEPSQIMSWLGFDLDLKKGIISVPTHKINALKDVIAGLQGQQSVSAKQIACVIGKIISMSIALGSVSRLMTRDLYALLNSRHSWFEKLTINPAAKQELTFWYKGIEEFNGQNIKRSPSAVRVVYSDASGTGFGGYMVEHGPQIAHGQWTTWEAEQSSTWRELKAVSTVLESFASQLANEHIRWFTDNQNVVNIILHGSKKPILQTEALKVFHLSLVHNLVIEPEWIPREENLVADYISKVLDYDDWMLHPVIFEQLNALWGPHDVDRFANYHNRQLERFNSRFWNPQSEAVDAFTVNWHGENNWWCPPVTIVPRVIQHACKTKAEGTLIVPQWPSAPFWPMLFPAANTTAKFVVDVCQLPDVEWLLLPGRSGKTLFSGPPNTNILALRMKF